MKKLPDALDYHDLSATRTREKKEGGHSDWTKAFQPPVLIDPSKDHVPSVQEAIQMLFEGSTASTHPDIAGYVGGLTESGENVLIKAYGDESLFKFKEFYDREHKRVGWFDYTVVPLVETLVKRRLAQTAPLSPEARAGSPTIFEKHSITIEGCGHRSHVKNVLGLTQILCYSCGRPRPITSKMRDAILAIEAQMAKEGKN